MNWRVHVETRLCSLALFAELDDAALTEISDYLDWMSLPGGRPLVVEGERGDALFVVLSGALGIEVDEKDGRQHTVTKISTGGLVGELSLITGAPRSATLVALRDTELLRLSKQAFDRVSEKYPQLLKNMLALLAGRLTRTIKQERPRHSVRNYCFIPAANANICSEVIEQTLGFMRAQGKHVHLCTQDEQSKSVDWFQTLERDNDFVFYRATAEMDAWTRLCLRQADRIFLVVGQDAQFRKSPIIESLLNKFRNRVELVFLHENHVAFPSSPPGWLTGFKSHFHHHVRPTRTNDIQRFSNHVTGQALGLVLAGGGARGFAHLGAIRALREKGLRFDLVGGTSMGAIVGAGLACGWDDDELEFRMREAFVKIDPLSDYAVPRIALMRGRKVTSLLRETFGDHAIEDLWRTFYCVSSDLTEGRNHIHREGAIWRALRASIAIPGILPPVESNGHVLADGAVMNNFPADVMSEMGRGPIVGVDVGGNRTLYVDRSDDEEETWRTMDPVRQNDPGIVNVLMRVGTVNSETQTKQSRRLVDTYFVPPVDDIGIRDWTAFERAIEIGYEHVRGILERVPNLFSDEA